MGETLVLILTSDNFRLSEVRNEAEQWMSRVQTSGRDEHANLRRRGARRSSLSYRTKHDGWQESPYLTRPAGMRQRPTTFLAWCSDHLNALPAEPRPVTSYLAALESSRSPSTIRRRLAAINGRQEVAAPRSCKRGCAGLCSLR
jgi:hypothetical protein